MDDIPWCDHSNETNKTDQKSIRKSCIHRLEKIYLLQYTEQYQREIQSTPDNSNVQKNYKENYKQMKIASS